MSVGAVLRAMVQQCHTTAPGGREMGQCGLVAHCEFVTSPIATATATLHTNRGDIKIALSVITPPRPSRTSSAGQGTKEYSTQNASGSTSGPFYDGAVSTASSTVS